MFRNHRSRRPVDLLLASFSFLAIPAGAGCLPMTITDNSYIGVLDGDDGTGANAGMVCCEELRANLFPGVVSDVNVSLAVTHTYIGDLVAKVRSPSATVSTILSRPGFDETADDGGGCCGAGTSWLGAMVLFDEQSGGPSTESMGDGGTVCSGNGVCEYTPDQGAATGNGLDVDFDGETYVGSWEVCVGDAELDDEGTWDNYNLEIVIDRSIPCVCSNKFRGGDRVRYLGVSLAPRAGESGANPSAEAALGANPPPVGTEGEVMCGQVSSVATPILVSWDGHATGHLGNGDCACPTGDLPNPSGYYMECNEIEFVLPFRDDFETGTTIRWSAVLGET